MQMQVFWGFVSMKGGKILFAVFIYLFFIFVDFILFSILSVLFDVKFDCKMVFPQSIHR